MDLAAKDILDALPSILGTAAVAPAMLVLWTIASFDERSEPIYVIFISFLFGAGGAFLISYARLSVPGIALLTDWPILQTYLHSTCEVSAPEEALKLFVLICVSARFIAYNHPMEGVVYGAAVGLGFAAYENLFYLANNPDNWKTVALMRGMLTVPVHGALGVIIGIYTARAKFGAGSERRKSLSFRTGCYLTGWGLATALHGLFDFPLMMLRRTETGQPTHVYFLLIVAALVAAMVSLTAAFIIYGLKKRHATSPNSFTAGHRFENHPWHLTGLACIALFLIALPLLGMFRQSVQ